MEQNCKNTRRPDSFTEPHLKGRFCFNYLTGGNYEIMNWGGIENLSIHHVLLLKIIILEHKLFPVLKAYYLSPFAGGAWAAC